MASDSPCSHKLLFPLLSLVLLQMNLMLRTSRLYRTRLDLMSRREGSGKGRVDGRDSSDVVPQRTLSRR